MKRSDLFFAFILLPLDITMIAVAFVLAHYLRIDLEIIPVYSDIGLIEYLRYSIYLMPAWIALFALNGLYRIKSDRNFFNNFFRIVNASSTAILILVVALFLRRELFFSRLIIILTWAFSILTISLGRLGINSIQRYLYKYNIGRRRIVLVGDNSISENIVSELSGKNKSSFAIIGIVNEDGKPSKYGLKVLCQFKEIDTVIGRADEIILTETNLRKVEVLDLIQKCIDHNITFKYVPDIFALVTKNTSAALIGSMPVMELKPILLDGWGRIAKRLIDIIFALFALIITLPISLLVALGIKLTSAGPILYSQKRVGRDGKSFNFYKFRSMHYDKCDFRGRRWTTKADEKDRITPFGLFLRKTNFDEIPQFFNVLIGEMSFVGPRPEQPKFVEQFQRDIPEYFRRHRVKSGITGWAQVNGFKGDTSIKERVKYDIYYIENWTLWFDLVIIAKTLHLIIAEALGGKMEYKK